MKIIENVMAAGFKGRNFSQDLQPINVIIGDNDRGKTAIADAVRVGLLGYLPSLGKTAGATFKLATGSGMAVKLNMNGSGAVSRSWEQKKGKITSTGPDTEFPDMLFDLKPFFSLSAAARTDYLLSIIPSASVSPDAFIDRVWPALAGPDDIKAKARDEFRAALKSEKLTEWTQQGLAHLKERKARLDADVRATQGFVMTQVRLQATDAEVENVRGELKQVEESLAELNGKLKAMEATAAQAKKLENMKAGLEAQVAELPKLEAALPALERELDRLSAIECPDVTPFIAAHDQARDVANDLNNELSRLEQKCGELEGQLDVMEMQTDCPHCGTKGEVWKPTYRALLTDNIQRVSQEMTDVRAELTTANEKMEAAYDALTRAEARRASAMQASIEAASIGRQIAKAKDLITAALAAKAHLAELGTAGPVAGPEDINELIGLRSSLETERATLREKHNEMIAAMQDIKRANQAKERLDQLEAEKAVYGELVKAMTEFRQAALSSQIGEFLKTVNRMTEGLIPSPIEYLDGEFGRFQGSQWISLDVFGGTYEALTKAGLCLALAVTAPVRIVILDELGRIDEGNKAKLISRVRKLIEAGEIHQFIGIDVNSCPAYQDVNLIKV